MKKSVFLMFAALAFAGFANRSYAGPPIDPAHYRNRIKVACMGDSITQGFRTSPGHDYPSQLQQLLGARWQVMNFGVSGRTMLKKGDAPYWAQPVFDAVHGILPDVVIILLGTNDTKPENWKFHDQFYADYKEFVDSFKRLPNQPRVFACLPCPGPGPGSTSINEADIQLEIPIIEKVAADEKIDVIDMHAPLVGKNLQPDGIHPGDAGAALLAQAAATALTGKPAP